MMLSHEIYEHIPLKVALWCTTEVELFFKIHQIEVNKNAFTLQVNGNTFLKCTPNQLHQRFGINSVLMIKKIIEWLTFDRQDFDNYVESHSVALLSTDNQTKRIKYFANENQNIPQITSHQLKQFLHPESKQILANKNNQQTNSQQKKIGNFKFEQIIEFESEAEQNIVMGQKRNEYQNKRQYNKGYQNKKQYIKEYQNKRQQKRRYQEKRQQNKGQQNTVVNNELKKEEGQKKHLRKETKNQEIKNKDSKHKEGEKIKRKQQSTCDEEMQEMELNIWFGQHSFRVLEAVTIGRDKRHEVVCEDESVSRTHARIIKKDGCFLLVDTGSKLGTFVEVALEGRRIIKERDIILFRQEAFIIVKLTLLPDGKEFDLRVRRDDLAEESSGLTFHRRTKVTVGGIGCDIRLKEGNVARNHAQFIIQNGTISLLRKDGEVFRQLEENQFFRIDQPSCKIVFGQAMAELKLYFKRDRFSEAPLQMPKYF